MTRVSGMLTSALFTVLTVVAGILAILAAADGL